MLLKIIFYHLFTHLFTHLIWHLIHSMGIWSTKSKYINSRKSALTEHGWIHPSIRLKANIIVIISSSSSSPKTIFFETINSTNMIWVSAWAFKQRENFPQHKSYTFLQNYRIKKQVKRDVNKKPNQTTSIS